MVWGSKILLVSFKYKQKKHPDGCFLFEALYKHWL